MRKRVTVDLSEVVSLLPKELRGRACKAFSGTVHAFVCRDKATRDLIEATLRVDAASRRIHESVLSGNRKEAVAATKSFRRAAASLDRNVERFVRNRWV